MGLTGTELVLSFVKKGTGYGSKRPLPPPQSELTGGMPLYLRLAAGSLGIFELLV